MLVLNDSLVQYEGNSVNLQHGGVTVSTSKSLVARAGSVTVSPAATKPAPARWRTGAVVGVAAWAVHLPEPKPRAMREHFVVSSIRSRDIALAQRSGVRHCEDAL